MAPPAGIFARHLLILGGLGFSWLLLSGTKAAEDGEFREFTNKEGRKIEARAVSVSTDRKILTIVQRDGREFELEIVLLSLDDQQFLRDWLQNRLSSADYRIEVAIDKVSEKSSERHRDRADYYRFSTEFPQYRITITNLARETLPEPVLEYCLLYREKVGIRYDENERDWEFSSFSPDPDDVKKIRVTVPLEPLVYNRDQLVTTRSVSIDRVTGDGNYLYAEDELLGVMLQIRDGSGNLIDTWRSSDPGVKNLTWEKTVGEVAAGGSNGSRSAGPGQSELDSYPPVFQKGEFVRTILAPDPDGKSVKVSAAVDLDEADPEGTILAYGGRNLGYALVVAEGELQFWVRRIDRLKGNVNSLVALPIGELPAGEFLVEAENTSTTMTLSIDGVRKASTPSVGTLDSKPAEGLSVGFDSGLQAVGPNAPPDTFAGAIRDARFELGN